MSTTDPKKIAFRGTTNRDLQKHIDSYFTTLGGINPGGLKYTSSNYYYFIDNSGKIIRASILPAGYIEREPGDYFKDSLGGIKHVRKFAFLGSKHPEIQKAILDFFIKLGASNKLQVEGKNVNLYYFIDATNKIINSSILPEGYIFQLDTYLNVMKNQEEKIPEYVECVDYFLERDKGKIYNTTTDAPESPSKLSWKSILFEMGRLKDGSFKVSTKEAYDAQNTYLKAADYVPQVGDYVIMEKAGGWGYHPDNDGCVAIVSRVGKNEVDRNEVFSIWGEVINPNNNRRVKFSGIPQFGYDKEVIFRKALPHEIPINTPQEKPQQVEESKEKVIQYPITPENTFPVKALKKQLKKVNFQSIHEIKIVEEKLLKKTKSKLFNI